MSILRSVIRRFTLVGIAGMSVSPAAVSAQEVVPSTVKSFTGFNPSRCAVVPAVVERIARRDRDTLAYAPQRDTFFRITVDSVRMCEEIIRALPEETQELLNIARVRLILGDDTAATSARARYLTTLARQPAPIQAWANLLIIQDDTAARPIRFQSALEAVARIDQLEFPAVWWSAIEGHSMIAEAARRQWKDSIAMSESNRVIALWRSLHERVRVSELRQVQDAYRRKADHALRLKGLTVARAIIDTAVRDIPTGGDEFPMIVHQYQNVLGTEAPAIDAPFWFRRGDSLPRPATGKITLMAYFGRGAEPAQDRLNRIVDRLQQRFGPQHFDYILVTRTLGYYADTAPAAPVDEARYNSDFMLHKFDSAFLSNHPDLKPMLAVIETRFHWNVEGRRINHPNKYDMDYPFAEFILVDKQRRIRYLSERFQPWMEEPLMGMIERMLGEDEPSRAPPGASVSVPSATCGMQYPQTRLTPFLSSAGSDPGSSFAPNDSTDTVRILDRPPVPGTIVSEETSPSAGVTVWTLSNGVRVVLKPTTGLQDQVLVRGYSWGGYSLVPQNDRATVQLSNVLLAQSGLGRFSKMELGSLGATTGVDMIGRTILQDREEVFGTTAVRGIESLFALFQLVFTSPRMDTAEAKMTILRGRNEYERAVGSLQHHFKDSLKAELWMRHPRSFNYSVEDIERTTPARAFAILRYRFSDASGYTFVIVGNFTVNAVRPLAERYLASLPALHRKDRWKSHGIRYPDGIVKKTFAFGSTPRSRTAIVFNGALHNEATFDVLALKALGEILKERLRLRIREQLSGTYGVEVASSVSRYPTSRALVHVEFDASPDRVNELSAAVIAEADRLRRDGPTEEEVAFVRREIELEIDDAKGTNDYWMEQLMTYMMSGKPLKQLAFDTDPVGKVTVATVHAYAKAYLDAKRYVQLTQVPK